MDGIDASHRTHRTLESVVRRVIACEPHSDDPAECGLGAASAVKRCFAACREYFVVGVAPERMADDERTLPRIRTAARAFMTSDGATGIALGETTARLTGENGNVVRTISYADMRMPPLPPRDECGVLDRTMGKGWRRRLWTVALLHRCVLWRRRGIERAIRDTKTALTIAVFENKIPPDILRKIVAIVRTP